MATAQSRAKCNRGVLVDDYWKIRCYEAEVEWVANCISFALVNEGQKPIIEPTVRAAMLVNTIYKANEVTA